MRRKIKDMVGESKGRNETDAETDNQKTEHEGGREERHKIGTKK